jgi:hypothetical protein
MKATAQTVDARKVAADDALSSYGGRAQLHRFRHLEPQR